MTNAAIKFVDTVEGVKDFLNVMDLLECVNNSTPNQPPFLYIDLEGSNLSRHGSISIMQIFVLPLKKVYLIDIHTLGSAAFTTRSEIDSTLKDLLEHPPMIKAFFDVRNDSDALYHLYGVELCGVSDIQLLELATRDFSRRCVHSLARCIERDADLSPAESMEWKSIEVQGRTLFSPDEGGSFEVFNRRPLSEAIVQYYAQNVQILAKLWQIYNAKIGVISRERIEVAVRNRVDVYKRANYTGNGGEMVMAPAGWE